MLEEEENQIRGFTYIFDCSGLTLSHLSIWTPQEVGKVISICEKNLPMRHRDINLLMLPFPMWAVFEFCKTLLSAKIRKRFSVHSSLDKLVTKLGGVDILPQEYGGRFLMFISIIQVNLDQLESIFGNLLLETILSVDLVFLSLGFIATPVLILKVLFGIPA